MPTLAGKILYLVFVPEVQNKQTGYKILEKLEVDRDNSINGKASDFMYLFKSDAPIMHCMLKQS